MIELGETADWTLLTGAGFTANWGTPVSQEVWSEIISDPGVHGDELLRNDLLSLNGFDFEEILYRAQQGHYTDSGRRSLEESVAKVFASIEQQIFEDAFVVSLIDLRFLLENFFSANKTGCIFTLNQDMLLERLFWIGHGAPIGRPGVIKPIRDCPVNAWNIAHRDRPAPVETVVVESLTIEPSEGWPDLRGQGHYIKLHGSMDWRSSDGSDAMILGGGKAEAIGRRPLLSFYNEVFKQFLNSGNKRLLTIGYGFQDIHINRAIADAIVNHGLRIHIWDVVSPRTMYEILSTATHGEQIWQGLCGYFQRPLRLEFPRNTEEYNFVSDSAVRVLTKLFGPNAHGVPQRAFAS